MKLSLASAVLSPYLKEGMDPREAYRLFRETGFTCVDFDVAPYCTGEGETARGEYWKNLFEECGLTVPQTHAPMFNYFRSPEDRKTAIEKHVKALRFCKDAGFPNTVIHPIARPGNTRDEFFENNLNYYRELIPYAEETGVGILIENIGHYMDPFFLWSAKDLREMIDLLDHPLVSACWDIGHANHFEYHHVNGSPYDAILTLGDKLTAIHAHDNVGFFPDPNPKKRVDMHASPYASGRCSVNWDAVMQGLIDVGYGGTFNFESVYPAPSSGAPDFVYHGETVRKLRLPPAEVLKSATQTLYGIGRFFLETYGVFEG